jgi:hydrogenase large subunit
VATRIVVDPVTRIEGHLRIEATMGTNGTVESALSSGTMWRGIEVILKGRDPRDAWAFTERICGVCTSIHAVASIRAVENALKIKVPVNAEIIRNIMELVLYVQDHVVHFYQLAALDWVDIISALKADPAATSALTQKLSPKNPLSSANYFKDVQDTVKKFAESGQLGIFANAYWGHPAYKLPPEANLMGVAHYLEALKWQKEIVKIHTVFGGKNPHPNFIVGGMAVALDLQSQTAINQQSLNFIKSLIEQAIDFVEQVYIPDLLAVASFYPEWTKIGGGLGNYMAYGSMPQTSIDDVKSFRLPRGVILNKDLANVQDVSLTDPEQIKEEVVHSWYKYPAGIEALHPSDGVTEPHYTGPTPPFKELDEKGTYSWVKAPRWKGNAMEVGPLARMVIGYALGKPDIKEGVNMILGKLNLPPAALFSTLGRIAARGLESQLAAHWLMDEYNNLVANLKNGDWVVANTQNWEPSTWPADCKGVGFTEAPRGALAHWIHIQDGKIANYQCVVPTTWNASPRDNKGQIGAYEAALTGTPVHNPSQPLELLRTVHSFDPCLACATHVFGPNGEKLAEVKVL